METLFEQQLQEKINTRTKPLGSLGMLERIAFKIGKIQHTLTPELRNPAMIVFAADHGIEAEKVSPCPKEITWQMVLNFARGGAGINVFCRQHNFNLRVIDVGVDYDFDGVEGVEVRKIRKGTRNMLHEPAMTIEECQAAMEIGAQAVREEYEKGCNIIGFGEMGIANTSPASLLLHKISGVDIHECIGKGAGLTNDGLQHKHDILSQVAEKHHPSTPLEILATFGGLEIASITGAVLEAKRLNMLIVADGFITSSGFLMAYTMNPDILSNVLFSHSSEEPGHRHMVEYMHGDPILRLGLRLGEGTGVALAYPLIQSALIFLNEMAGFDDAGVYEVEKHR